MPFFKFEVSWKTNIINGGNWEELHMNTIGYNQHDGRKHENENDQMLPDRKLVYQRKVLGPSAVFFFGYVRTLFEKVYLDGCI